MKKKIAIVCITFMIINFIILILGQSYAVCNTVTFTKEVSAVRLTLADGSTLYDIGVNRSVSDAITSPSTTVLPESYKRLNLIFVVETNFGVEQNKASMKQFINKIYNLYGDSASKIQMGVIPFEDLSDEEISLRPDGNYTSGSILKNSKMDIDDAVNNMEVNSKRTLNEALELTSSQLSNFATGGGNSQLLQYIVLITDGIDNQNVCTQGNVILRSLSDEMIAMYGVLVNTNSRNANLRILFSNVPEMAAANNIPLGNVGLQLCYSAYDYISQFVIKQSKILPTGGDKNTLMTPDGIILTADEEILHGATLWIEYTMSCSRYAYYGSGAVSSNRILDLKDEKLVFNENQELLTEPSRTNADYGWHMESEGLVTEQSNVKLVLSVLITPENLGNATYRNTAKCSTSFNVGAGSEASYNLSDTALYVQILPPFGEETKIEPWQVGALVVTSIMALTGIVFWGRARKINSKK